MELIRRFGMLVLLAGVIFLALSMDKLLAAECESDALPGRAGSCIIKPYEISNVLLTFFWFDTEEELQVFFFEKYGEYDPLMRSYSEAEVYEDHGICHLDLYAVRPTKVDDDQTLSIGHEVVHCTNGPDYHATW